MNVAFEILNYRYTAKLPTIVSSECVLDDLIQIDESLAGRIAERAKNLFELGPTGGRTIACGEKTFPWGKVDAKRTDESYVAQKHSAVVLT